MTARQRLKTVLYVDDEPDIREIVKLSLTLTGVLTVHTAESGEEALAMLAQVKPDLVLLDAMMPAMDGPTTLRHIRADADHQHIPVVFMTAKAMRDEVLGFRDMGAAGVIAKPFDPMKLEEQVVALWERLDDE